LSALRLLRKRLSGPPNRHIQPERYAKSGKFLKKSRKRELGTLKDRAKVTFAEDFSMTTEEFINL
jgi:hypothetical protein